MTTMETLPFWPYSYILWKVVYRNTRCRSIILVANIIWRSVHEIRSSSQTLYISSINSFSFRLYCLKAGKPVVQSRVLIHSSLILFSCFSHSYLSLRNKQPRRGGGGESLNTWVTCCYGQYLFSLFSLLSHF